MIRRVRPWLATFLLLSLVASPARAQAPPEEKDEGGFVMGYMGAGIFVCGIIYAVCKPLNRALATPKAGSTGPAKR